LHSFFFEPKFRVCGLFKGTGLTLFKAVVIVVIKSSTFCYEVSFGVNDVLESSNLIERFYQPTDYDLIVF
jgi:hypothetical protein